MSEQPTLFDVPPDANSIQERFERWLAENAHVYRLFVEAARSLKRQGRKRFGAKAIAEHLRWNAAYQTTDGYKLNNIYTSRLARKLLDDHPEEFEGWLELRKLQRD